MEPFKMLVHPFIFLVLVVNYGRCGFVYPSIQWEPNNPIFKTKNYTMDIIPFSKIRLVCPNPTTVATLTHYYPAEEEMYENVWIVDKNSYDACSVDAKNPANKIIFRCNKPSELNYHSIVFQMYSAIENGLEFTPGKTYYFISTSDGSRSSLDNIKGGHCESHNMRLAIHVCELSNGDCGKKIKSC